MDFVRVNLGLFQTDVNVIWDLATHDLSILDLWVPEKASWISAHGAKHYSDHAHQAYVTVGY